MKENDTYHEYGKITYTEYACADRIVRVGDRYLNSQDIELEIIHIARLINGGDIIVEFLPVDAALIGRHWQGEFLLNCGGKETPCRHSTAGEASLFPMLHIEDVSKLRRASGAASPV
ncbi:MAG: hypothetical protein AB1469_00215 [Pseudomonadota bacterium]